MKTIWALASLAAVMSACASYTPTSQPIFQINPSDWQVANNLAAAVDPYLEVDRQKNIFDADLTGANVLAVYIAVENRTDRAILVRPTDMQLLLPDGRAFAPVGISTTVSKIGESGSVVGAGLAFGLIGVLVASNAESKSRNARIVDYDQKAFREKYLAKGEQGQGVVFFIPPISLCDMEDAAIRVKFVDTDSASLTTLDVSMAGGKYGQMTESEPNAATAGAGAQDDDSAETGNDGEMRCAAL